VNSDSPISLDRFTWIQDFATRLKELGAPTSMEELLELGRELHETSADQDPQEIAESIWQHWPTDHGDLGLAGD
jgi:hypothetical protein